MIDKFFFTEKPESDGIDVLVVHQPDSVDRLADQQQEKVWYLFPEPFFKALYNCDVYRAPSADFRLLAYWHGGYGLRCDSCSAKRTGILALWSLQK